MPRQRFYVGQYGYFWSFSRDEIVAFFIAARDNGGGYDLPSDKEVGRPKGVYVNSDGGYWSSLAGPSGRYFEPLDWDSEAFADALSSIEGD